MRRHCDFIVNTEFSTWKSFTLVDFNAFTTFGEFTGFNISATRILCLSVLKFWIEGKYRMKETISSIHFGQDIEQYFPLYQTFLTAQRTNHIIPNGPKFSLDDFIRFS